MGRKGINTTKFTKRERWKTHPVLLCFPNEATDAWQSRACGSTPGFPGMKQFWRRAHISIYCWRYYWHQWQFYVYNTSQLSCRGPVQLIFRAMQDAWQHGIQIHSACKRYNYGMVCLLIIKVVVGNFLAELLWETGCFLHLPAGLPIAGSNALINFCQVVHWI